MPPHHTSCFLQVVTKNVAPHPSIHPPIHPPNHTPHPWPPEGHLPVEVLAMMVKLLLILNMRGTL